MRQSPGLTRRPSAQVDLEATVAGASRPGLVTSLTAGPDVGESHFGSRSSTHVSDDLLQSWYLSELDSWPVPEGLVQQCLIQPRCHVQIHTSMA